MKRRLAAAALSLFVLAVAGCGSETATATAPPAAAPARVHSAPPAALTVPPTPPSTEEAQRQAEIRRQMEELNRLQAGWDRHLPASRAPAPAPAPASAPDPAPASDLPPPTVTANVVHPAAPPPAAPPVDPALGIALPEPVRQPPAPESEPDLTSEATAAIDTQPDPGYPSYSAPRPQSETVWMHQGPVYQTKDGIGYAYTRPRGRGQQRSGGSYASGWGGGSGIATGYGGGYAPLSSDRQWVRKKGGGGYWRTRADGNRSNNYSSKGQTNPYTGKRGYR